MSITNQSSYFIEAIWDKSSIGLAKVDTEGQFVLVNSRLCELLEYTESELLKKKFEDITHPEDIADDWIMARKCLSGEITSYTMSKRYLTKTGRVVWVRLKGILVTEINKEKYFISQIIPLAFVERSEHVATLIVPKMSNVTVPFIKNNWKWLLGICGGLLLFSYKIVSEWNFILEAIHRLQQR